MELLFLFVVPIYVSFQPALVRVARMDLPAVSTLLAQKGFQERSYSLTTEIVIALHHVEKIFREEERGLPDQWIEQVEGYF